MRAARQETLEAARITANEFAADTRLPADPQELAAVRTGWAITGWRWPRCGRLRRGSRLRAGTRPRPQRSSPRQRQHLTEAAEQAAAARETATAAQALYEALLETAGAAVEELNRKLDELRRDTERRNADEKAARELEQQAISDRGKAEGTRDTLRTEIEEATRVRDAAVAEFRSFAATGMLRIALPDLEVPDPAEPVAADPHRDPGPGGQRGA